MSSLTIVVLPAPVGPTMATVLPAGTSQLQSWMTGCSGSYPKRTWRNDTSPRMCSAGAGSAGSAGSSASARKSNTRSAAAAMVCSCVLICASCVIGCVKLAI